VEGGLPEVMEATILLVHLGLCVKRGHIGCRRVVHGRLTTSVHLFRSNNLLVVCVDVNNRAVVESELRQVQAASGAVPGCVDAKVVEVKLYVLLK
jgi:hypothetical protein